MSYLVHNKSGLLFQLCIIDHPFNNDVVFYIINYVDVALCTNG